MALGAGTTGISGEFWGWCCGAYGPFRLRWLHHGASSQWFLWAQCRRRCWQCPCDVTGPSPLCVSDPALSSRPLGAWALCWLLCHTRCPTVSSTRHVQATSGSPPRSTHPVLAFHAEVSETLRAPACLTAAPVAPTGGEAAAQRPARHNHGRQCAPGFPCSVPSWAHGRLTSTGNSQGGFCVFQVHVREGRANHSFQHRLLYLNFPLKDSLWRTGPTSLHRTRRVSVP